MLIKALTVKEAFVKRHQFAFLVGALVLVLLAGSCDALFENQFAAAGLGQPTAEQLADLADSDDPAVAQPALALEVEARLLAGGARPIVDGLVNVLLEGGLEGIGDSGDAMGDLIGALIPEGILDTPGALAAAIDAITGSLADLDALAASVEGDSFAAGGIDVQTLAMTAALATVFDTLDPAPGLSIGEALESYYTDLADADSSGDPAPDISDYLTIPPGTDFGTLFGEGSTVYVLLTVAGIDMNSFGS